MLGLEDFSDFLRKEYACCNRIHITDIEWDTGEISSGFKILQFKMIEKNYMAYIKKDELVIREVMIHGSKTVASNEVWATEWREYSRYVEGKIKSLLEKT